jgi:hypothetical protein
MNEVANILIYPPPKVVDLRWRYWPFVTASTLVLLTSYPPLKCRCWYAKVVEIESNAVLVCLGLLIIRHGLAWIRKEKGNDWMIYLVLTIATPFVIGLMSSTSGVHRH